MRRPHKTNGELNDENSHRSRDEVEVTFESNISEPHRTRLERIEVSESLHRSPSIPKMASESRTILRSLESASGHRRKKDRYRSPEETRHHRRRSTVGDTDRLQPPLASTSEIRRLARDEESSESGEDAATQSGSVEARPTRRKSRVLYVTEEGNRPSRFKDRRRTEGKQPRDDAKRNGEPARRSRALHSRQMSVTEVVSPSPPQRSTSAREIRAEARPSLNWSNTTTSTLKPHHVPALANTNANNIKRSSFLGTIFGPVPQQHREPEKLVECLTCLSDDIPRSKSAKLKCGHRMCHSCLRRIFKLSITDPQHMPPKCCTADHIPLKHVERLFDINFKKTWNRKFQEYSTKNRIYCPSRRCGEWIKPGDIHKEDGRKYGKCSRCKTKVCCLCNGKWHGSKDCPKDEETNRLLETAKQAGWQRCYSCKAMVELKEGCNHMTCRCTAEFCMVCGVKWKSCNCPWFNYEAVEQDRLNHMRVPGEIQEEQEQRPLRMQPRPPNYLEQIHQRRRQERAEEEEVRRLRRATLLEEIGQDDDYQGGIGDIHGIGNGAGHFMNEDYVRATDHNVTGNMDQAAAAANYALGAARARNPSVSEGTERRKVHRPVLLRRHTIREQAYNTAASTRPSERIVPRRVRTDYETEAAVHAPTREHQRSASTMPRPSPRRSVLAGLGGSGRGSNRVSAWRTHVEPGVEPAEGVLSM